MDYVIKLLVSSTINFFCNPLERFLRRSFYVNKFTSFSIPLYPVTGWSLGLSTRFNRACTASIIGISCHAILSFLSPCPLTKGAK